MVRGLVHTENLFHPGTASTSASHCSLVWGHGACTESSVSIASWCSGSKTLQKAVLVLQQSYALGTVFCGANEPFCALSKGFPLRTPPRCPSWCLHPFILGSQSNIALHWS